MKIAKLCRAGLMLILAVVVPEVARSQQLPPFTYYGSATNLTGSALEVALHNVIKGHTVIGYTPTHDALCVLDRDPANPGNVIEIYSDTSVDTNTWPNWNREHMFPESFGTDSGTQHSDLFNLRACDQGINSSRGNKYYDYSTPPISHPPGTTNSSYDADSWEPEDLDKGFVARACFYMSTRYDGTGGDADLQLADTPNSGAQIFAKLSTLLVWNRLFPPTDYERTRNGLIYSNYQHNRNPFIDNPDFADMMFLGVDGFAAWENDHFSTAELSNAAVSAETADPDGDGVPNLAEYALGHNPHVPETNAIDSVSLQAISGTNYLYVTHTRNHYISGVTLTYQTSSNMTAWTDTAAEIVSNAQIDAQKDIVVARLVATGAAANFVRIRVHRLSDTAPTGPLLDVTPLGNFLSSGNVGGPFLPSNMIYTVSNAGVSNLNWTASNSTGWLTLSATSGFLTPGSSIQVTASVTAVANSLASGSYADTIFFANTIDGNGNTSRSATLDVVNQAPVILASGSTLEAENCTPPNGAIDPNETVTVSFSLNNVGTGNTSNLVATLVDSDNVLSPSGPQTYGVVVAGGSSVSESFTFTAAGNCGDTLTATLQLQDGVTDLGTINYSFTLGQVGAAVSENFDGVTAPALPSGWTTSASGVESGWVTSTAAASSAPNAAYSPDAAGVGLNELDSPSFTIHSASAQLTFRQNYSLVNSPSNPSLGYDGGVLEISIGGGAFQDILTAGGSFVSGAYNATLSGDYSNPLAGRQAWSGNSGGFITTTVNLPAAAAGQNVQLRWRCATGTTPSFGSSGTMAFWNFDATNASPSFVAAGLTATSFVVGNLGSGGSLTFFQGNPATGEAVGASSFTSSAGPPTTSYSYYGFSLSTTSGSQLSLSNMSFDDRASTTGPTNFTVQISQQSDFSTTIYDSGIRVSHVTSGSTFGSTSLPLTNSGLTGTVYFRIYGYKSTGSGGTWRLDNVNLQGSVTGNVAPGAGWYIDSVSISDTTCCGQ